VRTGKAGVPRELRFAVLTTEPSSSVVQMAVQLNLDAFILKPVSHADLEKRLAHILTTSRKLGSPSTYDAVQVPKTVEPEETPAPVGPPRPKAAVVLGANPVAAAAGAFRGAQSGAKGGKGGKDEEVDPAVVAARKKLTEIAAGAVLARPIIGTQGTPLYDEGTMLTASTLDRIRDVAGLMNFDHIWVYK